MNAFKQALVGTYSDSDTVIELNSISDTVGAPDYLVSGVPLILYDSLFGNPADSNNAGDYEIVQVTGVNYATNEITVTRAQENTTAQTIPEGWSAVYGLTQAGLDGKVNVSAIVNDLTTGGTDVPGSAENDKTLQDTKVAKAGDTMTGLLRATAGINFNASGGDTLEDYEVGTWTPVYTSSEGDFTSVPQSGGSDGRYVKIGSLVVVSCFYGTSGLNKGAISPSAAVRIKGLPYTIGNNFGFRGGGVITQAVNFTSNFPTSTLGLENTTRLSLVIDNLTPLLVSNLGTGSNNNLITLIHTYLT